MEAAQVETLDEALAVLRRKHGHRVVERGVVAGDGDRSWATGLRGFDALLPGGLPRGRVTILAGAAQGTTGVASLLNGFAARATRDEWVGYLDMGRTMDPHLLAAMGGDVERLLVMRPRTSSLVDAFAMCRGLMSAEGVRWFGLNLRRLHVPAVKVWESAMQGVVQAAFTASAVVCVAVDEPIPRALGHASSFTLACRRRAFVEKHGDINGVEVDVMATKNKLGAPGREARIWAMYDRPYPPPPGLYDREPGTAA